MDERKSRYVNQLQELGFYVHGRPAAGTLDADVLRAARKRRTDAQHIDRSFKYDSVLDPNKLGVTDVYELDGSPCIYFKSVGVEPSPEDNARWHKAAWNHGLARMLWVCTPTHILIFNAFAPPPKDPSGMQSREVLLFKSVAGRLDDLKSELLVRERIESGEFWFGPIGRRIKRETRIDRELVGDLEVASRLLVERGLDSIQAHRLLLRTIFIAYLEAKGILPKHLFDGLEADTFEEVLSSAKKTSKFFTRMRNAFNGDLFPPPPRDTSLGQKFSAEQLKIPQCILARTHLPTFQQTLNFWRYDFSVIPIELISSIYERFVHTADPTKARSAGTYYTPVNLVEFVLSQVFDDGLFDKKLPVNAKVLDMSCGSGVFLVEALRRLIARRLAAGEKHTRALVRDTLYNQIYGIDSEETAVEIAAFSLCLTAFELDPVPNSPHQLKFKEELKGRNLFVDDAFDPAGSFHTSSAFQQKAFNVVIGNPPWTRKKGPRSVSPGGKQLHVEYCERREPAAVTLPFRNPPDQAFVWRAGDFARRGARFGYLLEGKRFFSNHPQSLLAKKELFSQFTPRMFVNFCGLHDLGIIPSAKQPMIALIVENVSSSRKDSFPFVMVERDGSYRKHGLMRLGPENVQRLSVSLAASNPHALKTASWGSARDMAIVNRLVDEYGTLEQLLANNRAEMHQGFIVGNRARSVPRELHGLPCLAGGGMPAFEVSVAELPEFYEECLQWPRHPDIYRGPLILCASGLAGNRIVAAICRNDVVYSLSHYGVSFANSDPSLAFYINGILNSSLATFFTFLTATKWGLEKYEILSNDFLRLPIPDPKKADSSLVKQLRKIERNLRQKARRGGNVESLVADLDQVVFDLYGLDSFERVQVEDMLNLTIDFQRNHEQSHAVESAEPKECSEYAEYLIKVIQPFLTTRKRRRIVADVLDVDAPLQVVRFRVVSVSRNNRPAVSVIKAHDLSEVLTEVARNLDERIAFGIYTRRHLRVYADNTFYIVKPSQRRYWSRSAGLVDGDAVVKDFLSKDGNE